MNSLIRISVIVAISIIATYQPVTAQAKPKPIPVEVWCGGDDVLTRKLRDALENTFESSSDFVLSSGKKPGTLVVTIPTHVGWKEVGQRTWVRYTVEFTSTDDRKLGSKKGSCWDDQIAICASEIVKHAKVAARKIR